jgi:hypothetical protein
VIHDWKAVVVKGRMHFESIVNKEKFKGFSTSSVEACIANAAKAE